ncbi:P-loop containing nucleoside triphosphate hydrolase protein [Trichoderma cornu-damae]|uniref:P-loop containing nucleoside triphosphate hydrolase protein n=1 Tax=Trichoderma cornu-damae TaxID=654480 RepID=A0A9P8QJJ3_9HYPO|nr:P-loop containing nucleoside triphosphate hydrolase protein [Trichoderma cornu-damae]
MDYHAIHGHDIASFDTSNSASRVSTAHASHATNVSKVVQATHISTGLDALDRALLGLGSAGSQDAALQGGVKRGHVTEIWGPPGCGKTALGIQLAANALSDGKGVVWVDCFQKLQTQRIENVLKCVKESRSSAGAGEAQDVDPGKLLQYSCTTLPHLLSLISRPTTTTIAPDVSLIVISSLSSLINSFLPRPLEGGGNSKPTKGSAPSLKRHLGLQSIIGILQKLATSRYCAVVLLSQCATKMRSEQGATLTPAIDAAVWEQGVSTRLVLFRDWAWNANKSSSVFLAGLQKINGTAVQDAVEHVSAFKVEPAGISSVHYEASDPGMELAAMARRPKRKLGQTELVVPDSEDDEDYGWADEDEEALPPPPSQWQGSEDLILGKDAGLGEEEPEPEEGLQEYYFYEDDEVGDGDRSNNETWL